MPMQVGLAPLSASIVLAAALTKRTFHVFRFQLYSRPVGVGEGPIASAFSLHGGPRTR